MNELLTDIKLEVLKKLDFEPTKEQKPIFDGFLTPTRNTLITGGWRAGKSEVSAMLLVMAYPLELSKGAGRLYWIIGDAYETCREEFKKSLAYFDKLKLVVKSHFPTEGQCSMRLVGAVDIVTKTTDDEWRIAESAPDGILVVEAGRLTHSSWERIQGRLLEKRGWCVLSGTLEGSDPRAQSWYPELFWEWQARVNENKSYALPTWSNTVLFPLGRNDPAIVKIEQLSTTDTFQEKYGAIPVKPSGLIMKEFSNEIHVGNFTYNPDIPVEVAIDPGYGGAHAVLAIQIKESIPYIIREIYLQGYTTEEIILLCQQEWPFFKGIRRGAIDIYATKHQAMPAPIECWHKMTDIRLDYQMVHLHSKREEEGGIDLLRTFFKVNPVTKRPKTYVDVSCKGLIAECGGGKSPVYGGGAWLRDKLGRITNVNDHACKAYMYWLINRYGYTAYRKDYQKPAPLLVSKVTTGMWR